MGSRTLVFDVRDFRPNMEHEEMAQTFLDQFKEEHVISAIQIVPGGVCKVTFESAGVKQDLCSRDICNVWGVDCRVLNYAKRATPVQVHHYQFENDLDPLFKVLSPFGEVKRTRFQHWTNIPEINTGTILLDVILNHHPWMGQHSTLLLVLRSWMSLHLRRYLLTIVITSWMSSRASPSFFPLPPPALTLTLWMGQPLTLVLFPPFPGVPLLVVYLVLMVLPRIVAPGYWINLSLQLV